MTAYLERRQRELSRDRREAEGHGRRTSLPLDAFERVLTCTRCQEDVRVGEPWPAIDPEAYVCGNCYRPKGATA